MIQKQHAISVGELTCQTAMPVLDNNCLRKLQGESKEKEKALGGVNVLFCRGDSVDCVVVVFYAQ